MLACVLETRGATPRKGGSKMLISARDSAFSIGGGLAEARVLHAARALLDTKSAPPTQQLLIDLTGKPGAAGICGGTMRIHLWRWHCAQDLSAACALSAQLAAGQAAALHSPDRVLQEIMRPDPRLLIVGRGHCGIALYQLARNLHFDIWIYHDGVAELAPGPLPGASEHQQIADFSQAFASQRAVYAVLLNRDFVSDIKSLRALSGYSPRFLGMMGSAKRIAQVRNALPEISAFLANLHAPVGLAIGAQTPEEIAVSILAQLIQVRAEQPG